MCGFCVIVWGCGRKRVRKIQEYIEIVYNIPSKYRLLRDEEEYTIINEDNRMIRLLLER